MNTLADSDYFYTEKTMPISTPPFFEENSNPPAFWENLENLTTPSQRGGGGVQSMIFADWRVQNWKLGSNIILINKKVPGSNNFLINEVQHFGSYQDFPRFVIFFSKASLTLSGLKHGHRSLEFTNCIRKPEKLLQINKDNNSIN